MWNLTWIQDKIPQTISNHIVWCLRISTLLSYNFSRQVPAKANINLCYYSQNGSIWGALPKGVRFQLKGFQGLVLWVKIKEKQHVLKNSMCFSYRLQVERQIHPWHKHRDHWRQCSGICLPQLWIWTSFSLQLLPAEIKLDTKLKRI